MMSRSHTRETCRFSLLALSWMLLGSTLPSESTASHGTIPLSPTPFPQTERPWCELAHLASLAGTKLGTPSAREIRVAGILWAGARCIPS